MSFARHAIPALAAFLVVSLTLAGAAHALHPRPGSGTPVRVPLVPAYKQCTVANAGHVTGLDSCTPPQQESSLLTTGGLGPGQGLARLDVFCINGDSPPCLAASGDQLDIHVSFQLSDVRCTSSLIAGCAAPGADFTGKLLFDHGARLTDHSFGMPPNPGFTCPNATGASPCVTATLEDLDFRIPVQCTDNGGVNGANCNLSISYDTISPNFVKERQRATFRVLRLQVLDPGADGIADASSSPPRPCPSFCGTGDEKVFERAGYFAP